MRIICNARQDNKLADISLRFKNQLNVQINNQSFGACRNIVYIKSSLSFSNMTLMISSYRADNKMWVALSKFVLNAKTNRYLQVDTNNLKYQRKCLR